MTIRTSLGKIAMRVVPIHSQVIDQGKAEMRPKASPCWQLPWYGPEIVDDRFQSVGRDFEARKRDR